MALTFSNMMKLGTKAPLFTLIDTKTDTLYTLSKEENRRATVIAFICNHCPYVHHINAALVKVAKSYQAKGVQFIAISSNDIESHPQDAPIEMKKVAKREAYPFPYLYDETQEVAKAYGATCTPDFFVFDNELSCVYRGRFDETRPNKGVATGDDLSQALEAILHHKEINPTQHPSMGCNIKWK